MARRKKPDDQPEEDNDQNAANDDTFGLPEIEYEPINRDTIPEPDVRSPEQEEPTPPQSQFPEEQPVTNTPMERDEVRQNEYNTTYYNDEDEGNSPWPKIIGIIFILLLVGAGGWYFFIQKPKTDAARLELQQQEQTRLDSTRRADELRDNEQRRIAEENRLRADSVAQATPAVGTIETLNGRTGRYYVVVASAIDGDLIMDYAKKLSQKGINPKIIAPYGNVKFHRLTVADGETFAATQLIADGLKSEYTAAAWVIKY
ncbi:MAG TPA: SPOR domain-containing protein [Chryseosolibacter sp.]